MNAAAVWAGAVAAASTGVAGMAWRELRRGRELVARACHELRGPLTAAHLALHAGARHADPGDSARLAAIELELRRAGLALDDLAAARAGRRAGDRDDVVDVGALVSDQVAAWEPIAPVFGCELRVAPAEPDLFVRGDRV